ncbi:alpha-L-fucosidase-like [Haemaphysalis longicornis]
MSHAVIHSLLTFSSLLSLSTETRYTPDWKSLDTRPVPAWFGAAKFGILVHWGVYSVPSYGSSSENFWVNWKLRKEPSLVQFMNRHYKPGFTYQDFAPLFTAELFDPDQWADIFSRSGARYIILTAKHRDGFALWPSNFSLNWNSVDVGPHRDLVGELCAAVRRMGGMRFGVEYLKMEPFHPLYIADKASSWATADFPRTKSTVELTELVERYHPDIIWSQGDIEASSTYWNSTPFLAWLYNDSPVRSSVVVNDHWGADARFKHGDFIQYGRNDFEEHPPDVNGVPALPIDKYSMGYRREAKIHHYRTVTEIIKELVITISKNGSLILGLGPTKDGVIPPIFQERLAEVGAWLRVNGEAVYNSISWKHYKDAANPKVFYTAKGNTVYAFMLKWPESRLLYLESLRVSSEGQVTMLGRPEEKLELVSYLKNGTYIILPTLTPDELPSPWAWVLKVEGAI